MSSLTPQSRVAVGQEPNFPTHRPPSSDVHRDRIDRPRQDTLLAAISRNNVDDIELTGATGSPGAQPTAMIQTFLNPRVNKFRVVASCLTSFGNGLHDAAAGALLVYIEADYKIGYVLVSLIFLSNAFGYISAAMLFTNALSLRAGRAKTLITAEALMILGYISIVLKPPFAVVILAFYILGVGMAMNISISQVFVSNLANSTTLLGAYQGSYGLGGTIGPLTATAIVSRGASWSRFYLLTLALAAVNMILSGWSFWSSEQDAPAQPVNVIDPTTGPGRKPDPTNWTRQWHDLGQVMRHKSTLLGAAGIFAYQGAEVAISGWVISFLIEYRKGDPSRIGYVTAGFWGGVTIGRFVLAPGAHLMGERLFIKAVAVLAVALELIVWLVPSLIGDAVTICLSGLVLGPIYPCAINILVRLIPRKIQLPSLSFIGCIGSSGGAVAPFMTGLLAKKAGTFVLHPICIGLFVVLEACWWLLPTGENKD